MYGFKGTDENMKCRDFQYTLNQKYIHKGELKLCKSGFHLCKRLEDVFEYYSILIFGFSNRYFIVEYGENHIEEGNKTVSDTITLIEEITLEFILNKESMVKYRFLSENLDALLILLIISKGNLEGIKYLAGLGADITVADNLAIRHSCIYRDLEIIKYLVSIGADITARDNEALRYASSKGKLDIVEYLISLGADITARNNEAVRWAAELGHLDTVKYLISKGADITVSVENTIINAKIYGQYKVVKYIESITNKTCDD